MKNNKNRFKLWYDKYINKIIPSYGVLSLISCFVLNSTIYTGTQIILDGVKRYEITTDGLATVTHTSGYKSVFNFNEILYIGRKYDLEDYK